MVLAPRCRQSMRECIHLLGFTYLDSNASKPMEPLFDESTHPYFTLASLIQAIKLGAIGSLIRHRQTITFHGPIGTVVQTMILLASVKVSTGPTRDTTSTNFKDTVHDCITEGKEPDAERK